MDFLIFFHVLFSIEPVFLERAQIGVSLMITLTVRVFKRVGTKFPLFHFKSRRINLEVQFAILYEMLVMLTLV